MKIIIEEKQHPNDEDTIIIRCNEMNESLMKLIQKLKTQEEKFTATLGTTICRIDPKDVFYFESVDNKTFLYTQTQVYEIKQRLYEIEETFQGSDYFRASKSVILNVSKIHHLSPVIGSRLEAVLINDEKIIISRQYVTQLKELLGL